VVFVEGVHEYLPLTQHQKGTPAYWSALPSRGRKGYQGRSPWLVSSGGHSGKAGSGRGSCAGAAGAELARSELPVEGVPVAVG
jgi:hypothetical protein